MPILEPAPIIYIERDATLQDIRALHNGMVGSRQLPEFTKGYFDDNTRGFETPDPSRLALTATIKGLSDARMCGYLLAHERTQMVDGEERRVGNIWVTGVSKRVRRHGVFSALLSEAVAWAEEQELSALTAKTYNHFRGMRLTLDAAGFDIEGVEPAPDIQNYALRYVRQLESRE